MSKGTLTALFGEDLAFSLLRLIENRWSGGEPESYRAALGDMTALTLMQRVKRIAEALGVVLPADAEASRDIIVSALPAALGPSGKTFNDGYWVLPLAAYWPTHHLDRPEIALPTLQEITQRGTAEFAVRPFIEHYPTQFTDYLKHWVDDPSFHVRRLASEGTRPFLPWGGRLKVSNAQGARYFEIIRALADDESSYVRRSVGNHARDWRRIDASVAEAWLESTAIPQDVRKLAAPRRSRKNH